MFEFVVSIIVMSGTNNVHTNNVGEGWVDSISNTGIATGSNSGAGQYFMWTLKSGNQFIGGVSPGNNVGGNAGISANGSFICGTVLNSLTKKHEAGRYTVSTGTWTSLGGIGGSSGNSTSSGWNISGDGATIVGLAWEDAGTAYATMWPEIGSANSLGTTVPGSSTRANAVSHDGSVIAGWQDASIRQGAVWVNGAQELIQNADGTDASEASAVSSDGNWVTGMGMGSFWGIGDTYRYNTDTNLSELIPNITSGGGRYMAGAGITEDGQTIVGGTWPFGVPAYFGNSFIWREGIGTTTIETYLEEVGVEIPVGFHFAFASCISPDGTWIAGWGNFGSVGDTISWFVSFPSDATCQGDIDGSELVDVTDLLVVISDWGQSKSTADVSGDGVVDITDLLLIVGNWGPCE